MKVTKLLVIANIVVGALVLARYNLPHDDTPRTMLMASWVSHAPDVEAATSFADSVITGRVLQIRDAILRPEGVRRGDTSQDLPGEVVTFQVIDRDVRGRMSRGQRVDVFHLGRSGDEAISVDGDPPYAVGEEHVLFLTTGPVVWVENRQVETYIVVSPEGRWKVDQRNNLEAASDLEWAQAKNGTAARSLIEEASRAAERLRPVERD